MSSDLTKMSANHPQRMQQQAAYFTPISTRHTILCVCGAGRILKRTFICSQGENVQNEKDVQLPHIVCQLKQNI